MRGHLLRATVALLLGAAATASSACRERKTDAAGSGRIAEVAGTLELNAGEGGSASATLTPANASSVSSAQSALQLPAPSPAQRMVQTLARAAGGADGTKYTAAARRSGDSSVVTTGGTIVGRVGGGERASRDTIITPTHDLQACQPFTQRAVPSAGDGVGNAVAWLVGVASGPADMDKRRASLRLAGCRLEPRVQRVPVGSTVMVTSADVMSSRLRFVDVGEPNAIRATVMLNDAGQVVPTSKAADRPGLVEVRDDLHPWVRAWIAVSPHPFVAITSADGQFRFDGVPDGRYTLVVWSEALGTRSRELRVTDGVETRVDIKY